MSKRIMERPKKCRNCGCQMNRKRFNGKLESNSTFRKRKFCGLSCANARKDVTESAWMLRARKMMAASCASCGATTGLQVHHCDGDRKNLSSFNLQTLCVHCHKFLHDTAKRHGSTVPGRMACPAWKGE